MVAAIDVLDHARTDWQRLDATDLEAVVLLDREPRAHRLLIRVDESCPELQVSRGTGATARVELLGEVNRPIRPKVALQLDPPRGEERTCAARFSWRLGDAVGEMRPARPLPDGRVQYLVAPIGSLGLLLQPRLVVEVEADQADEFVVTRRALEIDTPGAFVTPPTSSSSTSSPP